MIYDFIRQQQKAYPIAVLCEVIIDLFSRKVVGWAMSHHMKASLVREVLSMAYW